MATDWTEATPKDWIDATETWQDSLKSADKILVRIDGTDYNIEAERLIEELLGVVTQTNFGFDDYADAAYVVAHRDGTSVRFSLQSLIDYIVDQSGGAGGDSDGVSIISTEPKLPHLLEWPNIDSDIVENTVGYFIDGYSMDPADLDVNTTNLQWSGAPQVEFAEPKLFRTLPSGEVMYKAKSSNDLVFVKMDGTFRTLSLVNTFDQLIPVGEMKALGLERGSSRLYLVDLVTGGEKISNIVAEGQPIFDMFRFGGGFGFITKNASEDHEVWVSKSITGPHGGVTIEAEKYDGQIPGSQYRNPPVFRALGPSGQGYITNRHDSRVYRVLPGQQEVTIDITIQDICYAFGSTFLVVRQGGDISLWDPSTSNYTPVTFPGDFVSNVTFCRAPDLGLYIFNQAGRPQYHLPPGSSQAHEVATTGYYILTSALTPDGSLVCGLYSPRNALAGAFKFNGKAPTYNNNIYRHPLFIDY